MKCKSTFFILISIILLAACSLSDENNSQNYNSSDSEATPIENISSIDIANPGEETQIELDDDAIINPTNLPSEDPLYNEKQEEDDYGCPFPNLTAEENANCGIHKYSVHKYVESGLCTFSNGEQIKDNPTVELTFQVNEDGFFDLGSSGIQKFLDERTGPNKYEVIVLKSDGEYYGTLFYEFSLTGFGIEEHDEINKCVFIREYTLIE